MCTVNDNCGDLVGCPLLLSYMFSQKGVICVIDLLIKINFIFAGTQQVHIIEFYWQMQLQVHCVFTNVYQPCKFLYSS